MSLPRSARLLHFEDALQKTGWGLYYKFLVGFAAATLFTNGYAIICLHFALPLSSIDTTLDQPTIATIFLCFAVGKSVGGFFLCSVSDNTGKRCMISKSLIIIFGSCFICAFSHNMYTLYLAAFFLGSGLQANLASVKIHLAEILPQGKRGFYMILPDVFWSLGYLISSVFMYYFGITNTNRNEHQGMDMRLTSWRISFAIAGGLCITVACVSALLEMSPRFLLFKRRIISASLVLKQFYAINRSKYSETFDVHSQQLVDLIHDYNINIDPEPNGIIAQVVLLVKVICRMLRVLLRRDFVKVTLSLMFLKIPVMFGISGFNLWMANIIHAQRRQVNGSDFAHLDFLSNKNGTILFPDSVQENFLLLSVNIFLGQIFSLVLIDRIGRKLLIFLAYSLCCVTSLALTFYKNIVLIMVAASFLIFGVVLVETVLAVVAIETFPTAVRGTAFGLIHVYSSLISSVLYVVLSSVRYYVFTAFGSLFFVCSIMCWFLPEMKGRPMVE